MALPACGPAPATGRPPNVLLITLDTTRADHCSAFGYRRDTTPRLSTLAQEGTRFTRAYAPTATTAPSHATLFTGLHPVTHGVTKNGLTLDGAAVTLAERLAAAGWETAGLVSSFVLHGKFGLGQGFEHWDDKLPKGRSTVQLEQWGEHEPEGGFDRRGDHTSSRAIKWLEQRAGDGRPFFLFVHYFDPHAPYLPPAHLAARFGAVLGDASLGTTEALYDAEIAFTDAQIGRLLSALEQQGLADDTLVIVTADHGEGLMQHGHMNHGVHVYEEAVHVPLIVRWPGRVPAARTIEEPVALVDVLPTVLDLLGLDADVTGAAGAGAPGDPLGELAAAGGGAAAAASSASRRPLAGRSLADALTGDGALDPEHPVWFHRRHYDRRDFDGVTVEGEAFAVRVGRWKYIEAPAEGTRELYDLQADPAEQRNLASEHPEHAAALAARLAVWLAEHRAGEAASGLEDGDVEALEALGYVR